jgi:hypothetical protein
MSKSSKLSTAIKAFNVSECVRDYKGNIEPDYCITEDLSVWEGLGVTDVDQLEKWLDYKHGFSDFHKAVHGVRPRWDYSGYTLSYWEQTYKNLAEDNERVMKEEEEHEALKLEEFKRAIQKVKQSGAKDFMTALRWMFQAEGVKTQYRQDVERFFWDHDILYTDYAKSLINRVCPAKR